MALSPIISDNSLDFEDFVSAEMKYKRIIPLFQRSGLYEALDTNTHVYPKLVREFYSNRILYDGILSTKVKGVSLLLGASKSNVALGFNNNGLTGRGQSAISVDDTLKIIARREKQKKLSALEMELVAARQEGFVSKHVSETKNPSKKRPLVVIGILTSFGHKNNRDAIRKAWMATGAVLKKMEDQKGIIARFVIGRSATLGGSLDRGIDSENKQTSDFFILEDRVEALEELAKKTKLFFALAVEKWDAEFYAKVNGDVYVNIDTLGNTLAAHLDKPHVYIGCMKSGEVFLRTEPQMV